MAKRRSQVSGDHFNLLPFISILMCTLGCLLLVTMSMATIHIGPSVGEGWVPDQKTEKEKGKKPILVEWDGKTAIAHLNGRRVQSGMKNLQPIFNELAGMRETHYVLFAVRPTGFENFNILAQEFRKTNLAIGYEPIAQYRPVRLYKGGGEQ